MIIDSNTTTIVGYIHNDSSKELNTITRTVITIHGEKTYEHFCSPGYDYVIDFTGENAAKFVGLHKNIEKTSILVQFSILQNIRNSIQFKSIDESDGYIMTTINATVVRHSHDSPNYERIMIDMTDDIAFTNICDVEQQEMFKGDNNLEGDDLEGDNLDEELEELDEWDDYESGEEQLQEDTQFIPCEDEKVLIHFKGYKASNLKASLSKKAFDKHPVLDATYSRDEGAFIKLTHSREKDCMCIPISNKKKATIVCDTTQNIFTACLPKNLLKKFCSFDTTCEVDIEIYKTKTYGIINKYSMSFELMAYGNM
jgi:uncharacterized pyridoxamine 5'-phosphate oxidase family protein